MPHCGGLEIINPTDVHFVYYYLVCLFPHGVCWSGVCRGHDALVGVRGYLLACSSMVGSGNLSQVVKLSQQEYLPAQSSQWPLVIAAL